MSPTAIILIALGGPRSLDEVGPFMEAFMGRTASPTVVAAVQERYSLIGGGSPLPDLVKAQAAALELELSDGYRVYEGFRYSKPTVADRTNCPISAIASPISPASAGSGSKAGLGTSSRTIAIGSSRPR